MIQNLLGLPIPIHLLALTEASGSHHYGNCMREAGVDVAVPRLAIAHALETAGGVRCQIVALMKGCAFGLAGKHHRFGLHFARGLSEDHIRCPSAAGLGGKEELWASLSP